MPDTKEEFERVIGLCRAFTPSEALSLFDRLFKATCQRVLNDSDSERIFLSSTLAF
jgi:hypothetical protein